jgi:hypothetical protein
VAKPDFDADTIKDAMGYFIDRTPELAAHGWLWTCSSSLGPTRATHWGVLSEYRTADFEYRYAIYVLKSQRGKGLLPSYIARDKTMKFITLDDCGVAGFYEKHGRDVLVLKNK